MKPIEIILTLTLIFAAVYNFDFSNISTWIVSILLLTLAVTTISKNSKLNKYFQITGFMLTIILMLKVLIF